jgi:hypothetical protein
MRPTKVVLNAAGYSQWVPISYMESWFGVGVSVQLSGDASGITYTVQHTYDFLNIDPSTPDSSAGNHVTISRSGTTATVTDYGPYGLGHGLSTGDSVIIKGSGSSVLDSLSPAYGTGDVGWSVTYVSSSTYTYTCANSGATADTGNCYVARQRVFPHATLATQSARGQGTYNYPVRAVRLYLSAYTSGYADMIVLQGQPQ